MRTFFFFFISMSFCTTLKHGTILSMFLMSLPAFFYLRISLLLTLFSSFSLHGFDIDTLHDHWCCKKKRQSHRLPPSTRHWDNWLFMPLWFHFIHTQNWIRLSSVNPHIRCYIGQRIVFFPHLNWFTRSSCQLSWQVLPNLPLYICVCVCER